MRTASDRSAAALTTVAQLPMRAGYTDPGRGVIPLLVTVADAARALTVSPVTVRTWMREGRLTKVKLGRRVAVTADSVAALISRGLM